MKTSSAKKIYFLENAPGQIVRALEWDTETLYFVYRKDSRRVEAVNDLKNLDEQKISYIVVDSITKEAMAAHPRYKLNVMASPLTLVAESGEILPNIEAPADDPQKFHLTLKKTSVTALGVALMLFIISLFAPKSITPHQDELRVVEVLDRHQIQVQPPRRSIVVTPSQRKSIQKKTFSTRKVIKQRSVVQRRSQPVRQMGALSILGQLKSSSQKSGLQISKIPTSPGMGTGGTQGSGGVQTAVYAKGMFAAPLGKGQRADGAGGYGTKGKGGGHAGYGKVSLAGSSSSFFEPIESETWVDGGLDRNEIAAVIQRHLSEVRYCYEQGLQTKPHLSGRVSMKFMIGAHGGVTTAQINNSSLQHPVVENCIRQKLMTWKFPQPEGGVNVKVSYPFVLRRVSSL